MSFSFYNFAFARYSGEDAPRRCPYHVVSLVIFTAIHLNDLRKNIYCFLTYVLRIISYYHSVSEIGVYVIQ